MRLFVTGGAGFIGSNFVRFVLGNSEDEVTVFDVIPTLKPSGRGELEITDVNNWFVSQKTMEYDVLEGFWGDAGESIDDYYTVNDYVRLNGANKD